MTGVSETTHFLSLAALKEAHNALLQRRRAEGESPTLLDTAVLFVSRAQATGALLDDDGARDAAQSLLTYWDNLLYRAERMPPDSTLAEFDSALAPDLPDEPCPYLGLDAFRESDSDKFFGRNELIARLVERLADQHLLAVVGPSGSGKSSLVRAGLIPALKSGALPGSQDWRYLPPIVPGSDPLASLDRILRTENQEPRTEIDASVLGSPVLGSPVILIVDQFEELFTLCDDDQARQAFVASLREWIDTPEAENRLVLTMRSDFETFIARAPDLQARFDQGRVQVTPLSAAELRESIEQPAEAIGLKFQTGIVDALLQDILGEPAGLPLLQFTLLKLWEHRDHNRVTREIYEHVGGGRLALARSADAFYAGLIPEEQVTARRILLRMIRPGEGLEITSSRIRRADLYSGGEDSGRVDRVLAKLIAAHLVRLTEGETPADTQVEVAHEALVRNWPTLVDWLRKAKAALDTRRRLEGRATEWVRLGQSSGGLLDDVELREAERWLESEEAQYLGHEPTLLTLVDASKKAITSRTRRTARLRIALVAVSLVAALLGMGLAIYAFQQRLDAVNSAHIAMTAQIQAQQDARVAQTAEAQAQTQREIAYSQAATASTAQHDAEANGLSAQASVFALASRLEIDPSLRLLLAIEAAKSLQKGNIPDKQGRIQDTLRQAILANKLQVYLHDENDNAHSERINYVAWSHDGKRILTASDDQSVRLWDASTGTPLLPLIETAKISAAAFSPNDQLVAIASNAGIYVRNSQNGSDVLELEQQKPVLSVAWSPDGKYLLVSIFDQALILDVATGKVLKVFRGHQGSINDVAWSPDGKLVATASSHPAPNKDDPKHFDGTTWIWDVTDGNKVRELNGQIGPITSVDWSPDGHNLLTASDDSTAQVWNISNGQSLMVLRHGLVKRAEWSPDGQRIITVGFDTTARIWDAKTGEQQSTLGGVGRATAAAWSPDGKEVIVTGESGIALIHLTGFAELLEQAKHGAPRALTSDERQKYHSGYVSSSEVPTEIALTPTPSASLIFSGRIFDKPTDVAVRCGNSFASRIWGVVRDQQGRGIRGALVQVQTEDRRNAYKTKTNSQGGFEVPGLGCTTWIVRLVSIPSTADVQSDSLTIDLNGGRYSGGGVEFRQN